MIDQIHQADFVCLVFTDSYRRRFEGKEQEDVGRGVRWEGTIVTSEMYHSTGTDKFIPVVFSSSDIAHIPIFLRGLSHYNVETATGYEDLYRRLTGQPRVRVPEIGQIVPLPEMQRQSQFFTGGADPVVPPPVRMGPRLWPELVWEPVNRRTVVRYVLLRLHATRHRKCSAASLGYRLAGGDRAGVSPGCVSPRNSKSRPSHWLRRRGNGSFGVCWATPDGRAVDIFSCQNRIFSRSLSPRLCYFLRATYAVVPRA
jgi:hypothetical protein